MCRLTPPELEHHWPQMPQVCARRGLASASLVARGQCCGETSNSSACGSLLPHATHPAQARLGAGRWPPQPPHQPCQHSAAPERDLTGKAHTLHAGRAFANSAMF